MVAYVARVQSQKNEQITDVTLSTEVTHLAGGYNYDSTSIRLRSDRRSTAMRPRHDHSTTYVASCDRVRSADYML